MRNIYRTRFGHREQFSELDDDKKVMEYSVMVLAWRNELDSLKEKE